jgi:ubiquinol-cytochrome c reductase cytochrome c1 subunit
MRTDRQKNKSGSKLLALAAAASMLVLPAAAFAAGGEARFEKAGNDIHNQASLQRGARNFVNYCLGCHTAKYVRYNRMAADLGIPEQLMIENLMFTGDSPQQTMTNGMNPADAKTWFGVAPPDLSLIARSRSPDYLYAFLRSFYADPTRATGMNNTVLPGAAMPHVLWQLQGVQEAVWEGHTDAQGNVQKQFKEFKLATPGELSPEQYDAFVRDTVNFLEYIGEPVQARRQSLGFVVIAFLAFFTLLSYALKKEYWKDVK